ncbi:unnamed protein product [Callosobruchus maculatus]|uniref:Uncharacterized protein n=1 Tax=Callosobruchus maculatus TaxID=64391 RepID=A0A653C5B1_CALMS|nr:unnamed protein product [Callosobruchus maculatus]
MELNFELKMNLLLTVRLVHDGSVQIKLGIGPERRGRTSYTEEFDLLIAVKGRLSDDPRRRQAWSTWCYDGCKLTRGGSYEPLSYYHHHVATTHGRTSPQGLYSLVSTNQGDRRSGTWLIAV